MGINDEIKTIFEQLGAGLELLGENSFKTGAHKRVARQLADMPQDVRDLVEQDRSTAEARLTALPDFGKGAVRRILEWVDTGEVSDHQKMLNKVPVGLFDLLAIPGLGPKATAILWKELGIESLSDLKSALESPEAIEALPRMGKKTIDNLQKALEFAAESQGRIPIGIARPLAIELSEALSAGPGVVRCTWAGSLRRGRESIGDIDLLVALEEGADPGAIAEIFVGHEVVTQVLVQGDDKCSVRIKRRDTVLQADLRIVPLESWGAALMYFTGSKEHNVKLRQIAIKKGLTLNEFGLFPEPEGRQEAPPQTLGIAPVASATEEEIYRSLDLEPIPPELREDRGEYGRTEIALIEESDLISELHAHTTESDGNLSLRQLVKTAQQRGLEVLAVTDHSESSVIAGGLTKEQLRRHAKAVRLLAKDVDLMLLAGSEVDILPDGSLDYDDELLAELDLVVASPHASLRQDRKTATERILRAIENPYVHIIGHPTGRKVGRREGLPLDIERIVEAAAANGTALEINANWRRLDLRDSHVRIALEAGCNIAINTDAHSEDDFDLRIYGVLTGRRAGLTPERCINTWPPERLESWLDDKTKEAMASW